jgi:hypothetical protein
LKKPIPRVSPITSTKGWFTKDFMEDLVVDSAEGVVEWVVVVEEVDSAEEELVVEGSVEEVVFPVVEGSVEEVVFPVAVVEEARSVAITGVPRDTVVFADGTPTLTTTPITLTVVVMVTVPTATAMRPPTTIPTITTIMQQQTPASAKTPRLWPPYPPNNRNV